MVEFQGPQLPVLRRLNSLPYCPDKLLEMVQVVVASDLTWLFQGFAWVVTIQMLLR